MTRIFQIFVSILSQFRYLIKIARFVPCLQPVPLLMYKSVKRGRVQGTYFRFDPNPGHILFACAYGGNIFGLHWISGLYETHLQRKIGALWHFDLEGIWKISRNLELNEQIKSSIGRM